MQLTLCHRCHFDRADYRRHDLVTAVMWLHATIDWCSTGRSDRIDHARHPGWPRAYAWVLEP